MPRACRGQRQARADVRRTPKPSACFYRACRRAAQARSVVLVAHLPPAGARLRAWTGACDPTTTTRTARLGPAARRAPARAWRRAAPARPPRAGAPPPTGASPPPCRTRARPAARSRRAAASSGCAPARSAPSGTLLGLYRGWGLRRPPVLAATNAAIARAAGCDERTVQKHLALLRARGLILVEYGPHNRRRPEPDAGPGDPAGIDLRPALVAAAELRALLDRLEAERRAAVAGLRLAQRALLLARAALAAQAEPDGPALEALEGHRRALRRARRRLNHPAAAPAALAALRQGLGQLRAALEALAAAPEAVTVENGVEDAVGKTPDPSSRDGVPGVHQTESNSVEASDGFRPAGSERPVAPDHHDPGPDEILDREAEARQRAHRLGLAARRLNEAIQRHGTASVVAAVDHVWRQREEGRLRSPAGLLVCLLRRPPDRLTSPHGPHAAGRWRPPLTPGEARALAAELAPAHDPRWLWRRFEGYRRQCGVELRDERRAFAGFARKCQRDRAGGAPWA